MDGGSERKKGGLSLGYMELLPTEMEKNADRAGSLGKISSLCLDMLSLNYSLGVH